MALEGSIYHDAYLFCSEDNGTTTTVLSCTSGFRNPSNLLNTIGGTSTSAPPFAGIVALINQKMGTAGLGNINPALYTLAASTPLAFHDVVTGDNIVPCTSGSSDCPTSSPFQFGFTAGVGYDQVSGLGSVDATVLANNWPSNLPGTTTTISPSATSVNQGDNVTFTATVTPSTATGTVNFYDNGSTTALGSGTLAEGVATFSTTTLPVGSNSVVATYGGDANDAGSSSSPTVVTVIGTGPDFTITTSADLAPNPVNAGQPATATLTVTPLNGSTQTISFSCTAGLPAGAACNASNVTLDGTDPANVTLTVTTSANMALGAAAITVTGTPDSGTAHNTTANLNVSATNQTYTMTPTGGTTYSVAQGATASIPITVTGTNGFVSGSSTVLPVTYTCSGLPSGTTCTSSPSGATTATSVTISIVTTAPAVMRGALGGNRLFYALLLPGFFGVVLVAGSRTRGLRLLTLIVLLACSTLWLGACSSSSKTTTPTGGTPIGTTTVTINATTGGATPVTSSLPITLTVTAQ